MAAIARSVPDVASGLQWGRNAPTLLLAALFSAVAGTGPVHAGTSAAAVGVRIILNPQNTPAPAPPADPVAGPVLPPAPPPVASNPPAPAPSTSAPPGSSAPAPMPGPPAAAPGTPAPAPGVAGPTPPVLPATPPGSQPVFLGGSTLCTSYSQGQNSTLVIRVACTTGQFVSIEPSPGQSFSGSFLDASRTRFGPNSVISGSAFPGGSLRNASGTLTAVTIQPAPGTTDLLEMLVSF